MNGWLRLREGLRGPSASRLQFNSLKIRPYNP
jgi:hypothetical protein